MSFLKTVSGDATPLFGLKFTSSYPLARAIRCHNAELDLCNVNPYKTLTVDDLELIKEEVLPLKGFIHIAKLSGS